jgi:hypothetical protein
MIDSFHPAYLCGFKHVKISIECSLEAVGMPDSCFPWQQLLGPVIPTLIYKVCLKFGALLCKPMVPLCMFWLTQFSSDLYSNCSHPLQWPLGSKASELLSLGRAIAQ